MHGIIVTMTIPLCKMLNKLPGMRHNFSFNLYFSFLAVLGLCCHVRAFSSWGGRGLLFVVVRGLLIAVASLVVEHRP